MIYSQSPIVMFALYVGPFVGILLAYDGVRQFLSREHSATAIRNRRLRMIKAGASTDQVLNLLLEDPKIGPNQRRSFFQRLKLALRQAGLRVGPITVIVTSLALFAVVFVATTNAVSPPIALLLASTVALGVPFVTLAALRRKRLNKTIDQLPEALDLMSRGLTVGHPFNVTVNSVATEMADPIGSEFGIIQDQVSYGDDIVTAFATFAKRVELEDARYLAVSVAIQHGTGGNQASVLQVLSRVIRDRATMRKKIVAITSEGRLSALILTVLPFAIFGTISVTSPTFYGDVQGDPLFAPFAAAILGLIALQGIILRRMVNFKF